MVIRGETTMGLADQLRIALGPHVAVFAKFLVVCALVLFAIWAYYATDEEWLLLRTAPFAALWLFLLDSWPFLLGGLAAVVAISLVRQVYVFWRWPHANKQLSYEADAKGVMTRDAAGFEFYTPWSAVQRVRSGDYGLRLLIGAGIWRTLFWRAFAESERAQVLAWARREI